VRGSARRSIAGATSDGLGEVASVAVGPLNLCVIGTGGGVSCTALEQGERFVTFAIEGVSNAVALAMGQGHACALGKSGEIWCWGATDELEAGGFARTQAAAIPVRGVSSAVAIAAYATTTCAVTKDGSVWCWRWGRRRAGDELAAELVVGSEPGPAP
jgi:hypothetical protein